MESLVYSANVNAVKNCNYFNIVLQLPNNEQHIKKLEKGLNIVMAASNM
jgi:hypothetical protein